jgi:hypothetical protein
LPSFYAAFYNRARAELSEVAELTVPSLARPLPIKAAAR